MIKVFPAIDLRGGAAVQLVGGDYHNEKVRRSDPLEVAAEFVAAGYQTLHVVDLDGALGRGDNRSTIDHLLRANQQTLEIQVGGGVRAEADIDRWLSAGATRVIVGTRAISDPSWLELMSLRFPSRLVLAADVRGSAQPNPQVQCRGWQETSGVSINELLSCCSQLPLAAVLCTAIDREGLMAGPAVGLYSGLQTSLPIYASGGIRDRTDLRSLELAGVAAAVVGMSLYTKGALS